MIKAIQKLNYRLREATRELENFSGTDLELDSYRRKIQFLTDKYDQWKAIIQKLRDEDKADSSSETTQNESGRERRRRAMSETQNYLGDTTTAPVTRDVNTPPTRTTDSSSGTETEGVEEVKDSEPSAMRLYTLSEQQTTHQSNRTATARRSRSHHHHRLQMKDLRKRTKHWSLRPLNHNWAHRQHQTTPSESKQRENTPQ